MKQICLIILFCLFVRISFAEEVFIIDQREKECIDKNMTTVGMANCSHAASEQWDKEMNKYYHLLVQKLGSVQKERLKEAQIAWIKFRDLEFKSIETFYFCKRPTNPSSFIFQPAIK